MEAATYGGGNEAESQVIRKMIETVRTRIQFADFVTHHTRASMFRQFNSENIGAALRWPFQGIVSLPLWSDKHVDPAASSLQGV